MMILRPENCTSSHQFLSGLTSLEPLQHSKIEKWKTQPFTALNGDVTYITFLRHSSSNSTFSFPSQHPIKMFHFRKLNPTQNPLRLKPSQNPRFHSSTKKPPESHKKSTIKEAQAALLEYLHSTRSLQFLDADNMCKNSPVFLNDLLNKSLSQNPNIDTKRSVSRYLRYHPINEFEPFFESAGLDPFDYANLLPREMIFLNDDVLLMENYHTLCNYGVRRTRMRKIFKLTPQVFRYQRGVLVSKLRGYEKLGVAPTTLVSVVPYSPCLLVGDADLDFVKVVEKFRDVVVVAKDGDWVEGHLLNGGCCNWGIVHQLLCLLDKVYGEEQMVDFIVRQPCVVFEDSGGRALSLFAFLVKFGLSVNQVSLLFLKFPRILASKFLSNLRQCFVFLREIEMEPAEIGKIFQSHSMMMGSSTMRKTGSVLGCLKVGKKRLRRIVMANPLEMENWVLGRKVEPLVNSSLELESKMLKKEFLLSVGYMENSRKLNEVIKLFRGKGAELRERFEFIVKAGLDSEDVLKMIQLSPRILNQTTDKINMKIEFLVSQGYPLSTLVNFPSYLSYGTERVKLRFSMYNWLKDHRAAEPGLALSTIIACSDQAFVKLYVNRHPSGLQVWQDLKTEVSSVV
ncbi:hypothetical protein RJT34_20279 [Clitoria ternatea]|uniref:Transcription termination factor MTEF18, mitochondrial n=1 Tax=Clitoria ternatea TaxID=43366 RepID=A0AAN9ISX7_CLITE